jgi:pimeloyl-[acyl-carrier protein] methyl ester esterase
MSLNCIVTGSGHDLVLLHGWGASAGVFTGLASVLATHFRVHAVDLPGYGASAPCLPYSLPRLVELLGSELPSACHVLGWSLGALAAMAWARSAPKQVARIALVAATPCFARRDDWPHGMEARILDEFERELASDAAGTIRRFIALQVLGDANARRSAHELRHHARRAAIPGIDALGRGLGILRDTDLRGVLAGIEQRALVVHGDRDRVTPAAAGQFLAHNIPGARFELVGGAAHAPFLSKPAHVGALLADFFHG